MTIFILDPGHGSNTKGKRSQNNPPGVNEWDFARQVAVFIRSKCFNAGIATELTFYGPESISLNKRVAVANNIYRSNSDCVFVSIHANAVPQDSLDENGWNYSAEGMRFLVHPRCSKKSRKLALIMNGLIPWCAYMKAGGTRDKDMQVLRETAMPAVLAECGFMTHPNDATKLASDYWRDRIAEGFVAAFREFQEKSK